MLNNLTNFLNIITGKMIKKVPEATDLITLGTRDSRYGGKYKPTGITVADFIDSIPAPPIGVQSVVAGTNVTVNNVDPLNPIVNSLPDGVQSIVAGTNVNVDNTDPANPIVNSLPDGVQSVVAGTNVTINNTDPANPIISAIGGGGAKGGVHTMVPFWGLFNFGTTAHITSSSPNSMNLSNDQVIYYPYIPNIDYTCGSFSIDANSAVVGAKARICVYTQNTNGLPITLVYSSADLDLSTTGSKTAITSFSFVAGNTYWLALQSSGTPNVDAISASSLLQVSSYTAAGSYPVTAWLQSGATFASGAPSPGAPNSFTFQVVPLITMTKL